MLREVPDFLAEAVIVFLAILILVGVIIFDIVVWSNLFSVGNNLGKAIGYSLGAYASFPITLFGLLAAGFLFKVVDEN